MAKAEILSVLRRHTGIDFSGYRQATVERRIANRMVSLGIDSDEAYLALLRDSPEEAQRLLERIAIKVSWFYRNPPAFDLLRGEVVPQLVRKAQGRSLRIWCAGCGNGEEAYSLAMLFDEAGASFTIEATDIDSEGLAAGARGLYPLEAAEEVPLDLAARYLATTADGERPCLKVADSLRARVRFTRHDLLFSAVPDWTGFDLVSCRNVIIYLQKERRSEVFLALRRALRPGGVLFLGEAEWPPEVMLQSLEVLGQRTRLFRTAEAA